MKQGSKRQGITGDWRQLGNKELYKSYSSPDNAMIINPGRMRWLYENTIYIYIYIYIYVCVCVCVCVTLVGKLERKKENCKTFAANSQDNKRNFKKE